MTDTPDRGRSQDRSESLILAFFGVNILLAILMYKVQFLANVHVIATVLTGALFAARQQMDRVLYVTAYIAGAEMLWRICHASVAYEAGKYALVAVCACGLFAMRQGRLMPALWLYFVLLIPSTVLTVLDYPAEDARQQLSFYLAGPLALLVATLFIANLRVTRKQIEYVLVFLIAPILGVAAVTVFGTVTAKVIKFTGESNFATSGGFGPNQVSSVLGLGVLASLFYALYGQCGRVLRLTLTGCMLLCAVQSAMTFSRNGLYLAAGAAVPMVLIGLRFPDVRRRLVLGSVLTVFLGTMVIFPRLNRFTGGKLQSRFANTEASHRNDLVWDDLRIWRENVVFGVGPGNARRFRHMWGTHWAAHTEFSRLPAEHGIFGVGSLILLLSLSVKRLFTLPDAETRALGFSLFIWTFMYMAANAMRLAAPSFVFALAFVDFSVVERQFLRVRTRSSLAA